MFDFLIHLLEGAIHAIAQATGGSPTVGILSVSVAVRALLLPITIRLGVRAQRRRQKLAAISGELAALQERHQDDQALLAQEVAALYEANGLTLLDKSALLGVAVQAPVIYALFGAVRRAAAGRLMWIADMARPDIVFALVISSLAGLVGAHAATLTGAPQAMMAMISAIITFAILSQTAAGLGLYWLVLNGFQALQTSVIQRRLSAH